MSRKKTVTLNLPVVDVLIKKTFRSNVVFSEKMGRPNQKTWVTDWHRKDKNGNPAPKGFPSPAEAAQMCLLLNTTPEEILAKKVDEKKTDAELEADLQKDIAEVRSLIEQEREKQGIKKDLPEVGEAVSPMAQEIFDFIDTASAGELVDLVQYIHFLKSKR